MAQISAFIRESLRAEGAAARQEEIRLVMLAESDKGERGPCCQEVRRATLCDFAATLEKP